MSLDWNVGNLTLNLCGYRGTLAAAAHWPVRGVVLANASLQYVWLIERGCRHKKPSLSSAPQPREHALGRGKQLSLAKHTHWNSSPLPKQLDWDVISCTRPATAVKKPLPGYKTRRRVITTQITNHHRPEMTFFIFVNKSGQRVPHVLPHDIWEPRNVTGWLKQDREEEWTVQSCNTWL